MCLTDVNVPHSYIGCLIRMNWYLSHKLPNHFVLLIILKSDHLGTSLMANLIQDINRGAIMANSSEYYF